MFIDTHFTGVRSVHRCCEKKPTETPPPAIMLADSTTLSESRSSRVLLSRQDFINAVREMPKVQLHDHLEGAVRPQTILEEADRLGLPRPAATVAEMKQM